MLIEVDIRDKGFSLRMQTRQKFHGMTVHSVHAYAFESDTTSISEESELYTPKDQLIQLHLASKYVAPNNRLAAFIALFIASGPDSSSLAPAATISFSISPKGASIRER